MRFSDTYAAFSMITYRETETRQRKTKSNIKKFTLLIRSSSIASNKLVLKSNNRMESKVSDGLGRVESSVCAFKSSSILWTSFCKIKIGISSPVYL